MAAIQNWSSQFWRRKLLLGLSRCWIQYVVDSYLCVGQTFFLLLQHLLICDIFEKQPWDHLLYSQCQPSWLSHVQLSLQLVQPRWGVGGRPIPIKMKKPQQLFISSFYVSSLHIVSAWTITVSSLGSPSPQHEARQEKTSTVPNSTGGPSSWGRYESIVQFLNKAFLTLPPSTLSWATKEGSSCSSNVVEEPHNLQALVWIE